MELSVELAGVLVVAVANGNPLNACEVNVGCQLTAEQLFTFVDLSGKRLQLFCIADKNIRLPPEVKFAVLHVGTFIFRGANREAEVLVHARCFLQREVKWGEVDVLQYLVVGDFDEERPVLLVVGTFQRPVHRVTAGVRRIVVGRDDGVTSDRHGVGCLNDDIVGHVARTVLCAGLSVAGIGETFVSVLGAGDSGVRDACFRVNVLSAHIQTGKQQGSSQQECT